ncbi:hypothetical protein ACJ73_10217 [Blastomyces percursus]|uniref:Uncharacterized protein n=1 Tax=Blastomyces percursus TaxID=1658174 RepID=A0A1J9NY72_9EURO|nr:hypothetical protein ACJ73_10217 [Blastomyces percursus]
MPTKGLQPLQKHLRSCFPQVNSQLQRSKVTFYHIRTMRVLLLRVYRNG